MYVLLGCLLIAAAVVALLSRLLSADHANILFTGSPIIAGIVGDCPSLKRPFRGVPLLCNGFLQTLCANIPALYPPPKVAYKRELLMLSDGGQVGLDWVSHPLLDIGPSSPVVVVLHGISGSSKETYIMHICATAARQGWRPVVMVARGLGGVELKTWKPYSHGGTDDVRETVRHVRALYPSAPILAIGYSLGANVISKFVAEEGAECALSAAAAVSGPLDLMKSKVFMRRRGFVSRKINTFLVSGLIRYAKKHQSKLVESPHWRGRDPSALFRMKTIEEFDDAGPAVLLGYQNSDEYHLQHSAMPLLHNVRIPLVLINSKDDPMTGPDVSDDITKVCEVAGAHSTVVAVSLKTGGHNGFLEGTLLPRASWADKVIVDFFRSALQ